MNSFIGRSLDERRLVFEQTAAQIGLPAATIEKDLWVCWTLRELFALPELGPQLTFKGGTSLSKVWRLIDRFSEDIDLTFDREALNFGGDRSPERAPSRKQQKVRLEDLKTACQHQVHDRLGPELQERIRTTITTGEDWRLIADDDDPDFQTLLFYFPSCWQEDARRYLRPVVKMEFGARSDPWPVARSTVKSFVAEVFPSIIRDADCPVQALQPERTFWEKAMLLHEETYRPSARERKPRMARHYFDLWSMIRGGVAERAMADAGLFQRVAQHRSVYFRWTWMDYGTLRKGSLRVVPTDDQVQGWRSDYEAMRQEMFMTPPPPFDDVLNEITKFESEFNRT